MRITLDRPHQSIVQTPTTEDLPPFVVVSGLNGSGKSHMLEAFTISALSVDGILAGQGQVRLFTLGQLIPLVSPPMPGSDFADAWLQTQQQVVPIVEMVRQSAQADSMSPEDLKSEIRRRIIESNALEADVLDRMEAEAGKGLSDFNDGDYWRYSANLYNVRSVFDVTLTEIIQTYYQRYLTNSFASFQLSRGEKPIVEPIDDVEFVGRFGPPPWEAINASLAAIGLPYTIPAPAGMNSSAHYQLRLLDSEDSDRPTGVESLSSGEKVLLAIATCLYEGSGHLENARFPKLLLLDEVDATLHPSMVRQLLEMLRTVFVDRYGVNVILATHSATTVALAPEDSIYVMRRSGTPRLLKATRDAALSALTAGVPVLSVEVKNRRAVFTEGVSDQVIYDSLYKVLRDRLPLDVSLDFISAGGGSGNRATVIEVVRKLRSSGNARICGIIDRDSSKEAAAESDGVFCALERYSIENFILDPVAVGTLLVIDKGMQERIGLPSMLRVRDFDTTHRQKIAEFICTKLSLAPVGGVASSYLGGWQVQLPESFMDMPAHDIWPRLSVAVKEFGAYRNETELCRAVIAKVFAQYPEYVPSASFELLNRIALA